MGIVEGAEEQEGLRSTFVSKSCSETATQVTDLYKYAGGRGEKVWGWREGHLFDPDLLCEC